MIQLVWSLLIFIPISKATALCKHSTTLFWCLTAGNVVCMIIYTLILA